MIKIIGIIAILLVIIISAEFLLIVKYHNASRNRNIITDAIFRYRSAHIWNEFMLRQVDYCHRESIDKTVLRLWDWGYEHILPIEKYALVKKYINK